MVIYQNDHTLKKYVIREIRNCGTKITSTENNALLELLPEKEVGYLGLEGMLMNSP
jgi:hypothetical protein